MKRWQKLLTVLGGLVVVCLVGAVFIESYLIYDITQERKKENQTLNEYKTNLVQVSAFSLFIIEENIMLRKLLFADQEVKMPPKNPQPTPRPSLVNPNKL
jgi:hypothetical protein